MRVGLVLPGFSAHERDWCIPALLDLVRCFSDRDDIEVEVFPLRYPNRRDDYVVHGAHVHPQGGGTARRLRRIALMLRAERAIRRAHRRAPFDLLHAYWADEPGLVTTLAAADLGIPSLVSLAGGELARLGDIDYGGQVHRSSRLMVARALKRATYVTAGSRYLQALAAVRVQAERLSLLPFGVDTSLFSPDRTSDELVPFRPASSDAVHILHVASLVPVKDQQTLIRAMARVVATAPNAHLHIAGEGPLGEQLATEANRLALHDHVHFHGAVEHHELPRYYRAADFCALSSRYEAQGMVILEAAACGRATVGTAVGLLPELCADGAVAAGDDVGLARVMLDLVQDAQRRRDLGDAARCRVERDYGLRTTVDRQCELYRSLAASTN